MSQLSESELFDASFLRFFGAVDPEAAARARRQAVLFTKLQSYGWSLEQLILAAKTGYTYATHTVFNRRNWKFGTDAKAFNTWLRHHYSETRAVKAGMSFDAFVEQWCEFSSHLIFYRSNNKYTTSLDLIKSYVKARRAGMSHDEAEWWLRTCDHYYPQNYLYLELRSKGLKRELARCVVDNIVQSTAGRDRLVAAKYVLEVLKRGATIDQLVGSVGEIGAIESLALSLRKAARTSE